MSLILKLTLCKFPSGSDALALNVISWPTVKVAFAVGALKLTVGAWFKVVLVLVWSISISYFKNEKWYFRNYSRATI